MCCPPRQGLSSVSYNQHVGQAVVLFELEKPELLHLVLGRAVGAVDVFYLAGRVMMMLQADSERARRPAPRECP